MKYVIYLSIAIVLLTLVVGFKLSKRGKKKFKANVFNSIITPICSIISVILFVVIAYLQNNLWEAQNKLMISQSFRPTYEKKVKEVLEMIDSTQLRFDGYVASNPEEIINLILTLCNEVTSSIDYVEDSTRLKLSMLRNRSDGIDLEARGNKEKIAFNKEYLATRSYFNKSQFIAEFFNNTKSITKVLNVMFEIENSPLHNTDKVYFIRELLYKVQPYFFLKSIMDRSEIYIPSPYSKSFPSDYSLDSKILVDNMNMKLSFYSSSDSRFYEHMNVLIGQLRKWDEVALNEPTIEKKIFSSPSILPKIIKNR